MGEPLDASCSIRRSLEVVGERWTLLVLREAFNGVRRFEQLQERVGCARNLLSARLATLVEHGVLERVPYREPGRRERHEYRLTEKGVELFPILIALMDWGDKWATEDHGPPVVVRHRGCGAEVTAEVRCAQGHGPLTARETYGEPVAAPAAATAA